MLNLNSDIQFIKGVGEKRAKLFNSLGVFDVDSLLHFYPRKYEDKTDIKTIAQVQNSQVVCIRVAMITPVKENYIRKGMTLYKCRFSDGRDVLEVTIFNNKYLAESLKLYNEYILYGKIEKNFSVSSMSAPQIEPADFKAGIYPVYPAKNKLNSRAISKVVSTALDGIGEIPDILSGEIRRKYSLVPLDTAIRNIHFPPSSDDIAPARNRLIFDELLILQLGFLKLKSGKKKETAPIIKDDFTADFKKLLPFDMTKAQSRVTEQCIADMQKNVPMNRLIQGDVGSGKTAVAATLIHTAVKNGYQAAFMAPTEILAAQHFETLEKMLASAGIRIQLLTGSVPAKQKREIKSRLLNGEIDLLIGTHAIIQNDVEFKKLALVITDEQHRFGVRQRAALALKGISPHTVVMSATPIPRTLGLILYGDLDISIIDELPPGRQEIRTDVVNSSYNSRLYKFILDAVDRGEQCYIVCPAVEENELDVKSAKQYAEELADGAFRGRNLALLHGKMKPAEKERVMKAFADGDVQILVSTTVVEVGVDVASATIMVVEDAESFGLSQLHQLRGRVGRGDRKSYCVLVSDSKSESARKRLMTMKKYSDGFKIADEDLKLRGPGDFFGQRQHGLPELKIADMANDMDTLRITQQCAREILEVDPDLTSPQNSALALRMNKMFENASYS
ncbi:MAG: ATP-dependent DNA helicase RecG [Clostridiales bacterium]|nr:ATP-dependent DNA helicase RecG [Clostridiales bacterium]